MRLLRIIRHAVLVTASSSRVDRYALPPSLSALVTRTSALPSPSTESRVLSPRFLLSPQSPVLSPLAGAGFLAALIVAAMLALGLSPTHAAGEVRVMAPESISFKPDANIPGVAIAMVAGNPKDGPYTIRAKFSPGVKIPAHYHPDERVVTVISGTYWFAAGDKFDDAAIKPYGPGTVIVVPAKAPHFSACKDGEAVVQEAGVGPTGITIIK